MTAVGPGVDGFKVGDRVAYVSTPGSYAEARNVDVKHLVALPADVSYETGGGDDAQGPDGAISAAPDLSRAAGRHDPRPRGGGRRRADPLPMGQASRRDGHRDGRLARRRRRSPRPAAPITSSTIRKRISPARVGEITKGAKCAVVYDGVGKTTFPGSLDCLRPFGVFASFGSASGPVEAFNLGLLGQKGSLFATRPTLFTFLADRARLETMAKELFEVVGSGVVKVDISERAPLAEAARVHRDLEGRRTTASIVLIP